MSSFSLNEIKLVLFDVDGVMTDGSIHINESGEFYKTFNAKDGIGIELLRIHNILTGVISGKSSKSLAIRCEQLAFDDVIMDCKNKLPALNALCKNYGLNKNEVAFVGDDVLDIPLFKVVGFSVSPSDAHELALKNADHVTAKRGGEGMVREFVDFFLKEKTGLTICEIYQPLLDQIMQDDTDTMEQ